MWIKGLVIVLQYHTAGAIARRDGECEGALERRLEGYGNIPAAAPPPCPCGIRIPKRNAIRLDGISFWSRIRESNPPPRLGKPLYYRCTNPAYMKFELPHGGAAGYGSTPPTASAPCRCTFSFGCAQSCDAVHRSRLATAKCLRSSPPSAAWEAAVLPMYESCVEFPHIIASFRQKSNRFLANNRRAFPKGPADGVQQSFAPAGMASSIMRRCSFSSPFSLWTAEMSMPQDSRPIIFLGGRLTIAASVLPTSCSGS